MSGLEMQGIKGLVEMFLISIFEMSSLELEPAVFLAERGFAGFRAAGLLLPGSLEFACFSIIKLGNCTMLAFLPSFLGDVDRGMKIDGAAVRVDEADSEDDAAVRVDEAGPEDDAAAVRAYGDEPEDGAAVIDLRGDGLIMLGSGNGCAGS